MKFTSQQYLNLSKTVEELFGVIEIGAHIECKPFQKLYEIVLDLLFDDLRELDFSIDKTYLYFSFTYLKYSIKFHLQTRMIYVDIPDEPYYKVYSFHHTIEALHYYITELNKIKK